MYTRKTVTFSEEKNNQVHFMYVWDFAYHQARQRFWETVALDRVRFQMRIRRSAVLLDWVLDEKHREKIFIVRFMTCNKD